MENILKSSTTSSVRKLRGTIVNMILPPRVLFYRSEFYFTATKFILLPQILSYCREFYFTAARFILLPRVLFYRRKFYFHHRDFYFHHREFCITAARNLFKRGGKIKLAAIKQISRW